MLLLLLLYYYYYYYDDDDDDDDYYYYYQLVELVPGSAKGGAAFLQSRSAATSFRRSTTRCCATPHSTPRAQHPQHHLFHNSTQTSQGLWAPLVFPLEVVLSFSATARRAPSKNTTSAWRHRPSPYSAPVMLLTVCHPLSTLTRLLPIMLHLCDHYHYAPLLPLPLRPLRPRSIPQPLPTRLRHCYHYHYGAHYHPLLFVTLLNCRG